MSDPASYRPRMTNSSRTSNRLGQTQTRRIPRGLALLRNLRLRLGAEKQPKLEQSEFALWETGHQGQSAKRALAEERRSVRQERTPHPPGTAEPQGETPATEFLLQPRFVEPEAVHSSAETTSQFAPRPLTTPHDSIISPSKIGLELFQVEPFTIKHHPNNAQTRQVLHHRPLLQGPSGSHGGIQEALRKIPRSNAG